MNEPAYSAKSDDDGATWETLAFLRFLLAAIVAAVHVSLLPGRHLLVDALAWFSSLGAIVGFLMISGFSIAHSIDRRRDGFYRRRIGRIYPLYALSILFGLVIRMLFWRTLLPLSKAETVNLIENLFFLQTYIAHQTPLNLVVWTLAIEVGCYAAAPWLARRRTSVLLWLGLISAMCYALYPLCKMVFYAYGLYGGPLLLLGWAWVGGFAFYRHRDRWPAIAILAGVTYLLFWLNHNFVVGRGYPVTFAVVFAALAWGSKLQVPRVARKAMTFFGDVSYPLYLFHVPTIAFLVKIANVGSIPPLLIGSLVVAVVMLWVDERLKQPTRNALDAVAKGFEQIGLKRKDRTPNAAALRPAVLASSHGPVAR